MFFVLILPKKNLSRIGVPVPKSRIDWFPSVSLKSNLENILYVQRYWSKFRSWRIIFVLFPADLLFVESRMIVKPFYEILLAFSYIFHKSPEY